MNSTNPNRGHYNPPPIIDPVLKQPTTGQDNKPASSGKGGRS